jgi:hypothetical protein
MLLAGVGKVNNFFSRGPDLQIARHERSGVSKIPNCRRLAPHFALKAGNGTMRQSIACGYETVHTNSRSVRTGASARVREEQSVFLHQQCRPALDGLFRAPVAPDDSFNV